MCTDYGISTGIRGSSRNRGMTEKKPPFINYYYDVITFERDSRHFTNVRKLTVTTGSFNFSSHELIERLCR